MPEERTSLLHFLAAQREAALAIVAGLSEADARRTAVPSGWSLLSMLEHLAGMERYWFGFVLSGAPSRPEPEPATTLAAAVISYREVTARSDLVLAALGLDDLSRCVPRELPSEINTVRDVVLHVIEETARHNGHLDIARELLDGRTGLGPR